MLLLAALLFLFSAVGTCLAPGLSMLIAARVLGGIGVGVASNVAPLYISEIAPARIRGRLVTFYQLAITIGILLAFLSNAGLHEYANTHTAVATAGSEERSVGKECVNTWKSGCQPYNYKQTKSSPVI